jgi:outer membrane lipoprotein-sorting protein
MSVMASRPVLRWAVPGGIIVAVLGAGVLTSTLRASADTRLPARSAAQLLVDLQTARLDGASGTVVERADLGLPPLAGILGGGNDTQITSLIAGSHTLKVWYSGPDKARVALLAALGEQDIVHNGTDTWVWNSQDKTAVHYKETDGDKAGLTPKATPSGLPTDMPKTPQELADRLLAALDPTTAVSTDSSSIVAGHAAYSLVLKPKDTASLVSEVRIAIDGKEHVPTRVEVFAKGYADRAAFEVGFTQVSFTRPDNGVFTFNPPPGTKVTEADESGKDAANKNGPPKVKPGTPATESKSVVIGKGWTAVLVERMPKSEDKDAAKNPAAALQGFLNNLPQVKGSFGTGHVLNSRLFTALVLDDGRILVGAVSQERLMAVASDPAAALK